jgi:chemotaxis protein MotB
VAMNAHNDEVPPRVIRKKVGHGGHHGGAWKVAYADFVTAMMALFIVLWIVGQSKQIKQYVANYFKDPGAIFTTTKGGSGPFDAGKLAITEAVPDQQLKREEAKLREMEKTIQQELAKKPSLAKLANQVKIEFVKEGMRIELLERSESFFFDVGTANLKPDALEVLNVIAASLGELPNHVIVEGHTDSRKYSRPDGYSNFELSADRANSARRALVADGVAEGHIDEVRGYADRHLRDTADPFDVTNRRISIIIKFADG